MVKTRPDDVPDMSIGALSHRSGVKIETIRYYEKLGLVTASGRTEGRHRLFDAEGVRRLRFVRRSRELGFSTDQIRHLIDLQDRGDLTCGEVQSVASAHLDDVRARIKKLRALERTLREAVANCAGGTRPECAIIDALNHEDEAMDRNGR